jgi:hypothetical protein
MALVDVDSKGKFAYRLKPSCLRKETARSAEKQQRKWMTKIPNQFEIATCTGCCERHKAKISMTLTGGCPIDQNHPQVKKRTAAGQAWVAKARPANLL